MESNLRYKKNKPTMHLKTNRERERLKRCIQRIAQGYTVEPSEMDKIAEKMDQLNTRSTYNQMENSQAGTKDKSNNDKAASNNDAKHDAHTSNANFVRETPQNFQTFEVKTIEEAIKEIKETLEKNKIILVQGPTGCGKTTQVPKLLMSDYQNIVCTQPRRLAAISMAQRVSQELKCDVGTTVGYSVRFETLASSKTRLKFITDGMLIHELCSKRKSTHKNKIAGYDLIVIDEAHERTVNIDFLLGYIKSALLNNPEIETKMLIMSATFQVDDFVRYFHCPLITIHHAPYPIEYFYLESEASDYVASSIQTVERIVNTTAKGDILVFLTGQNEIDRAYNHLTYSIPTRDIEILKLFSSMPPEEQDLIFRGSRRKIILSTNIAETSITLENVEFVVDSGKFKINNYSTANSFDFLEIVSISKAQAKQRAGRAGRTQPGTVFRMYTQDEYSGMKESPIPEILRSNLESTVLNMKSLGINDVFDFDYIDRPSEMCLSQALRNLYYIRALDSKGCITSLGKQLVRIPLDPELALCLVEAHKIGCLDSVATICAFLEYSSPFLEMKPDHPQYNRYKKAKKYLEDSRGDFYTFLRIFECWKARNFSFRFLKEMFLNERTMHQISSIRKQILALFPAARDTSFDIKRAFSAGFFMRIAKIDGPGYRTLFGGTECFLHNSDPLSRFRPKYVIFGGIFCSNMKKMVHTLEISIEDVQYAVNRVLNR